MSLIEIGTIVGDRYEITRLLGAGGMGVVYEAIVKHEPQRRRVAIKFLNPQLAVSREWRKRFEREVRMGSSLKSDHIARIRACGTEPVPDDPDRQWPWIAFDYLEGESLGQRLERGGSASFEDVAWMIEHLLRGLDVAHRAGLVHRDIKPANLFLEGGAQLRILDFGIAKELGGAMTALTNVDKIYGTRQYISPEQFANSSDVDGRADLYSAGLVAYELLTGALPDERRDPKAITEARTLAHLPPLGRTTGLAWPSEVDAWIQRMANPRRDERFRTANDALAAWLTICAMMKGREPLRVQLGAARGGARPADTVTAVRSSLPRR
ncbi:serine/threonine-protein kinase [Pendulispora albinea]|uniref:Serine/threonine protein kinase n=1 Tax=Pendulispora albinea TaxID=2741071 RepID=A0ABZ2M387_9BACT